MSNCRNSGGCEAYGRLIGLAGAVACILAGVVSLPAATVTWTGGGDGVSFGTVKGGANANWDGGVTPTDLDDIVINPGTTTTVNYDTAIFPGPASATNGPKTITIGNSGGGTTTLNVTADLYSKLSNLASVMALTVNTGGIWQQVSSTTYHNDHVLVDGGTLLMQGGAFTAGAWPAGIPLKVTRAGTVNVTGGTLTFSQTGLSIIGETNSGYLTLGTNAIGPTGGGYLQIGNGTTGTGTVNWTSTNACPSAMRQLDIQGGTMTIATGAGSIFLSTGRAGHANIEVGMTNGIGVLNKNNASTLGADRYTGTYEALRVGTNGTLNWADGDFNSNQSDAKMINNGVFNFTRSSGGSYFKFGPVFENTGHFNWIGTASIDLRSSNVVATSVFSNNTGTISITGASQRILYGSLFLGTGSIYAVELGAPSASGLVVTNSGANGGAITVNGTLQVTQTAGFQPSVNYNILTSSLGGAGITFNSLNLPSSRPSPYICQLVDDGTADGSVTIKFVPRSSGTIISVR